MYETIDYWKKNKMARPKNLIKTSSKNVSVHDDDIKYIEEKGIYYKNIIALGVKAHKSGWSSHSESSDVIKLQERLSKMSLLLDSYLKKFDKLCVVVEKGLDLKISEDLSNIDELQKKLEKVYKMGDPREFKGPKTMELS